MAGAARIVALDVGTCTVKAAEFLISPNATLTLNRYGIQELGLDPNKEEDRAPFIIQAVTDVLKRTGIKPHKAVISVSGQSVFMRFVKLPPVDAIQVEQMIGFEAQQNVPFPINEVVWDYQVMPGRGGSGENEAIIVAMKADLLESEHRSSEAAGLKTALIDVAPLALYNAYRYNYDTNDQCTLVIDLGARTTNLLFIEGNNLYTRGIPIAGNLISQNICNEMQEPFVASETLKKGKGFVSLGGAYADPEDRDSARISKLIRSTMTRLHNEINRSISFYRTHQGGSAPKRVFLTGGSSQIPYVDVFIGEKLNLPVEYFNPLQNVNIAAGIDRDQLTNQSCFMGELVGLALRESGTCPVEISLIPPALKATQARRRTQPYYLLALAVWILMFVLVVLWNLQQKAIADEVTGQLRSSTGKLSALSQKIKPLETQLDGLNAQFGTVNKLQLQRNAWADLLNDINKAIPDGVWITSLTPMVNGNAVDGGDLPGAGRPPMAPPAAGRPGNNRPGQGGGNPGQGGNGPQINQIYVRGLYHASPKTKGLGVEVLNKFVVSLAQSPWFDIDAAHPDKSIVTSTTVQADSEHLALDFQLSLKLKKQIDLSP
jgi:type IV pilus assembly protein PilM